MTDRLCDKLDDYLGGWLEEQTRTEFEAHLERCGDCRMEAARQQRLDAWLARTDDSLESVPPHLVHHIERRLAVARWRSRAVWAAGLAAAAVVLLGVLLWPHHPETAPLVTCVDTSPRAEHVGRDTPFLAPLGHSLPSQQLAILVASHCGSSCPSPHRWTRLPRIMPVTPRVQGGFATSVLSEGSAPDGQTGDVAESQPVVLRSSAPSASGVQARRTLGARQIPKVIYR